MLITTTGLVNEGAMCPSSFVMEHKHMKIQIHTGVPKNALSECCWTNSALVQSPVADTPCVWKSIFWSFLSKTEPKQDLPSHMVKFGSTVLNFGCDFFLLVTFLGHPV